MLLQFVFSDSSVDEIGKILSPIPFQLSFESTKTNAIGISVDHTLTSTVEALANRHPELKARAVLPRIGQGLYFLNDDRAVSIAPSAPRELVLEHVYSDPKSSFCQYCLSDLPNNNSRTINQLTFRRRPAFHIFRSNSNTIYASERLIDAATKAGFEAGMNASPVKVDGATDLSWFSLTGQPTQHPPGPFGHWGAACLNCRSDAPGRYQIGEILCRPHRVAHWMNPAIAPHSLSPLLVSGRLFRWLTGPGSHFIYSGSLEVAMRAKVCGWYPEDAGYFYLPRNLHASDAPVLDPAVLPYMTFTELPRIGNPPIADAKWREEATKTGLFRTLDQALGWDHDIVYILELSNTDTTELLAEDLANFRNLRELRLRGTKVQALPDALFDLRNLTRVDLRDTPVPPEELARLRARLRPTVKLQTSRATPKRPPNPR